MHKIMWKWLSYCFEIDGGTVAWIDCILVIELTSSNVWWFSFVFYTNSLCSRNEVPTNYAFPALVPDKNEETISNWQYNRGNFKKPFFFFFFIHPSSFIYFWQYNQHLNNAIGKWKPFIQFDVFFLIFTWFKFSS